MAGSHRSPLAWVRERFPGFFDEAHSESDPDTENTVTYLSDATEDFRYAVERGDGAHDGWHQGRDAPMEHGSAQVCRLLPEYCDTADGFAYRLHEDKEVGPKGCHVGVKLDRVESDQDLHSIHAHEFAHCAMSGMIPDEMRDRVLGRVADDVPLHEIKDWVGNGDTVAYYEGRSGIELKDWTRTNPSTGHDHLDSGRFLADPDTPGADGIKLFLEEAVVYRGSADEAGKLMMAEDRHRAPLDSRAWGDVPDQIEAFVADLNRVHRGALDPSQIESRNPFLAGDGPAFGMQDAYDVTPGVEATEIPSPARPPRLSTRSQGHGR